jgi:hypothetical protein
MQPTFLSHSRRDLYLLGADIASQATTRVYLLARSLILLTGPRPYGLSPGVDYEESHQDALRAVLEKARGGRIRFACGYLIPTTREEIREYPQLRDTVKRRLIDLHDAAHGTHFSITTPGRWSQPFTFIVGDNRFAIWFRDPAQDVYICISSEDKTVATGLVNIFDNECKAKALEALLGELGI